MNVRHILLTFTLFMILLIPVYADVDHHFTVNLEFKESVLSYTTIDVEPTASPEDLENTKGGYIAEIVSDTGDVLHVEFFALPLFVFHDAVDEESGEIIDGGIKELDEVQTTINLPYFENAQRIVFYDKDVNELFTIDVGAFALNENTLQELEDKIPDKMVQNTTGEGPNLKIIALIAGLIVGAVFFALTRRKK